MLYTICDIAFLIDVATHNLCVCHTEIMKPDTLAALVVDFHFIFNFHHILNVTSIQSLSALRFF